MDSKILGINTDTFFALLFLILLLILGIVSFHYYIFIRGGDGKDALRGGIGMGFSVLPGMGAGHPMHHKHHKGCGHMPMQHMDMNEQMPMQQMHQM